jgi:hypothetical protein
VSIVVCQSGIKGVFHVIFTSLDIPSLIGFLCSIDAFLTQYCLIFYVVVFGIYMGSSASASSAAIQGYQFLTVTSKSQGFVLFYLLFRMRKSFVVLYSKEMSPSK